MDDLFSSLIRIQHILNRADIPSAAIGALALSVWGRGRTTNDVDLKVAVTRENAQSLLSALPSDFRPTVDDPLDMLDRVGFVFVRDPDDIRIDLLLADFSFDEEALARAIDVEISPGQSIRVCTAEDLVIYKLISTRARDFDDAENVILRQGRGLDIAYIERWLTLFESALDDSTLLSTFRRMYGRVRD